MQVPADQVIAILTQELGDLHRENAILKVQVGMLTNELNTAPAVSQQTNQGAHASSSSTAIYDSMPTSQLSALPQVPDVNPSPSL